MVIVIEKKIIFKKVEIALSGFNCISHVLGNCSTGNVIPVDSTEVTAYDKKLARVTWSKLYKNWDNQHGTAFFVR